MKPHWLEIAEGELGTHEIAGAANNRRIIEYHMATTLKATNDETPWCSSFVNWVMKTAGYEVTHSAAARSWLHWGIGLGEPEVGCIVVLKRGAPPSGHVCFFATDLGANISCIGGNQGDEVKYSVYPKSDVLAYRWPVEGATA